MPPDLSNMNRFLSSPLPKQCGVVQCYIRRNKNGTNKLFPIYSLYLKEGDVFLLASKKRPKNKTSNYLISSGAKLTFNCRCFKNNYLFNRLDLNDLNRSGENYIGKLRSNFVGTEFQANIIWIFFRHITDHSCPLIQIFDNGVNPKDSEPDEVARGGTVPSNTSLSGSTITISSMLDGAVRCEMGAVMYAANVLGSRGPRKMQVALPGQCQRVYV